MLISERLGANKWYTATVQELFYEVCADRPEKEAIFYNGEFITYGTLQDKVNQLSQALINLGIGKGDRVAMLPSPTPDFVYLYYAVLQIGAVINPLNLLWGQIELSGILRRNDPKLIVTVDNYGGRDYIELLKNSITDLTIEGSTVSSKGIPSLKHMVACSKTQQKHEGFSDFHELLASGSGYDSDHLLRGIKESKPRTFSSSVRLPVRPVCRKARYGITGPPWAPSTLREKARTILKTTAISTSLPSSITAAFTRSISP